ncbi:MAG: SulP family sulfate permease [Oceanicoccus sp.]|jgi:SulP family sulfate permease
MYYLNLLKSFKDYHFKDLRSDVFSGLIVSLVSLPLAMSFSISVGLGPELGLYSAIIGGFLAALFGGSETNIVGPTGAFVAVLGAIMIQYGYEDLLIAGMLSGVILLLASLFRLGSFIQYVPYPVILGFTGGIGIIILSTQLGNMFGLEDLLKYEHFHENLLEVFRNLGNYQIAALGITALTMVLIEGVSAISKRIPAPLVGIVLAALVVYFFDLDVKTIEDAFGAIPQSLPSIQVPSITLNKVINLLPMAFTIAALASIETLLSALASDSMKNTTHNSSFELVGIAIANMVGPLFGAIPVSGAIARTTLNAKSGSRTRVAAMFNAIFLFGMMMLLAPLVNHIPLAALAGLLVLLSVKMIDVEVGYQLLRDHDWTDFLLLMSTFLLTIFVGLTMGIAVGMSIASLVFLKKMSDSTVSKTVLREVEGEKKLLATNEKIKCEHIGIYTIDVPLFFGTARSIVRSLTRVAPTKAIILRLTNLSGLDATGLQALKEILDMHSVRHRIYLSGIDEKTKKIFKKTGLLKLIGEDHIFEKSKDAINAALLSQGLKKGCDQYKVTSK